MTVRHITGDCRHELRKLDAESVHMCACSPPYWGLRDYNIKPSVWGGDPKCRHQWGATMPPANPGPGNRLGDVATSGLTNPQRQNAMPRPTEGGSFCCHCGAWRGCFGLEPTYQLYIEHIVDIFREVWRVLRKDGTLWLNMGDCYANRACGWAPEKYVGLDDRTFRTKPMSTAAAGGTAKTNNGHRTVDWGHRSKGLKKKVLKSLTHRGNGSKHDVRKGRDGSDGGIDFILAESPHRQPQGLREKNLMMMPARVAIALQDDGWILRADVVWAKANPMPESVYDRPTKAHEYLFLFAKSNRTRCWRHAVTEEWVRTKPAPDYVWRHRETRTERREKPRYAKAQGWIRVNLWRGFDYYYDFAAIMEPSSPNSHARAARSRSGSHKWANGGPTDEPQSIAIGSPPAGRWIPSPAGWSDADGHHGSVHADGRRNGKTSPHAVNGAPRHRNNDSYNAALGTAHLVPMRNKRSVWPIATKPFKEAHFATFPPKLIEPCILAGCPKGGTVLDIFGGAGTTGVVADAHGRNAILIEINPDYVAMARRRVKAERTKRAAALEAARVKRAAARAVEKLKSKTVSRVPRTPKREEERAR